MSQTMELERLDANSIDIANSRRVDTSVGPSHRTVSPETSRSTSNIRIFGVIFPLCMINFFTSFTAGIVTVGLPTIATSISLPRSLYLWPMSIYGLTAGSTLLLAGSVADLLGARRVEIAGSMLASIFTFACGISQTGVQLVVFRALQGIAISMHLPASVALIAAAVPHGRKRNISFGCLGLSQPLGFSAGLVVSGVMIEKIGWRSGFYFSGGATFLATLLGIWSLPKSPPRTESSGDSRAPPIALRLWKEIDWCGGTIAAVGLALLAYVLALLSADLSVIHKISTGVLIGLSIGLLVLFPIWIRRQERAGKPALIPNSIWAKRPFTATCIMVALSYGAMNAMEVFSSLYFQEIQNQSTLSTSLRILPNLIVGALINTSMGLFVDKLSARWLVTISSSLCAGASLLMALVNPQWNYWYMEFWAQCLAPLSGDVLFTVGILIVSDEFPEDTQALAGAVFNTVAQLGMSLGIGICQVVALAVESHSEPEDVSNGSELKEAHVASLLRGYQASFWVMFGLMIACSTIAVGGLHNTGKVGVKRE